MPTLNWIGKDAVINHHKEVPFRLLKCRADLSVGDPDSGNLLVKRSFTRIIHTWINKKELFSKRVFLFQTERTPPQTKR